MTAARRRNDYRLILDIVSPGSRVLDLGCGAGQLLTLLEADKNIVGYGVELDGDKIIECVESGLSVFQGDLDEGLRDFDDGSFDYVILNQTLPVTHKPPYVVDEMLRVGKRGIISFANFAYWRIRWRLLTGGRMPVGESIPYEWYDTPNIHHLTIQDFFLFCRRFRVTILDRHYFSALEGGHVKHSQRLPNWFAAYGMFVITRGD
ncbi:MAG: methionine biosynthesis protein MetW [Candidatus Pacebacteria bacterium]|nr:methionine biosynthesis protein MetW [Candidatus Paceibacterota bacterium]